MHRFLRLALLLVSALVFIPLQAQQDGNLGEYWEYTFRPGDTLWKIAEQYTDSAANWQAIQQINQKSLAPNRRILPGTRILIPLSMLKQQPTPAEIIALSGGARVQRADGEQLDAEAGMKLYGGDRVITFAGQSLRIRFADQSEMQVLTDSVVLLDKISYHRSSGMVDTRLRLNYGGVETRVRKLRGGSRFQIHTPAAITAVRGTAFRLSSDRHQVTRSEVTEGVVSMAVGDQEKAIEAGFGLVAEQGKPLPDPVKLLSAVRFDDGETLRDDRVSVSWTALDGAERYRYQLAQDTEFHLIVADGYNETHRLTLTGLSPGVYYLRVRGVDRLQLEGENAQRRLLIPQAPPQPDPLDSIVPMEAIFPLL